MLNRQFMCNNFLSRIAAANTFTVANALVWYAGIILVLQRTLGIVGEQSWLEASGQTAMWGLHFAGLIFSALLGAKIAGKINRYKFLIIWATLNVALSLTLFGLDYKNFIVTAAIVSLYGVSFGLGMPMCISQFSDSLAVENRGRTSGIVMLISGIGIFALAAAPFSLFEVGIVLSIWRLSSLVVLVAFRSSLKPELKKRSTSFRNVLGQRSFLAYYVPWMMFSFVNFLVPLQPTGGSQPSDTILLIRTIFLAIFAVFGGFLLDFMGRKRIAITGFIMLGLAAAARGIDYTGISSLYFSAIFEGTAWGLLLVLFILTLWGDLSDTLPCEKYYVIGVIPFFISMFIGFTIGNRIENNLPATSLFPFAAFFLFVAVLPLFYSTETLPDKIIKGRELKSYLEKAQKFAQRKTEKHQSSETEKNQEKREESKDDKEENQGEYDEARKLAEKYY